MTLPTPDARLPRSIPRRPQIVSPTHSITPPIIPQSVVFPSPLPPEASVYEHSPKTEHEQAINFATHSWDLATGGLKTLTAKRELPIRPERRTSDMVPDILASSRSYLFVMVIMLCVVLMLIGGGIVLFVMIQP